MSETQQPAEWELVDEWSRTSIWRHRETRAVRLDHTNASNRRTYQGTMTQGEAGRLGRALLNAAGVTR